MSGRIPGLAGCVELEGSRVNTHSGRDVPLLLAVVESHDFVGADARLALAGAHCQTEAFRDDRAEIRQLFDVPDRQGRRDVREGNLELVPQLCEDPWGRQEVDGHDLRVRINFLQNERGELPPSYDVHSGSKMWFPCRRLRNSGPPGANEAVAYPGRRACYPISHQTPFCCPCPDCGTLQLWRCCSTSAIIQSARSLEKRSGILKLPI